MTEYYYKDTLAAAYMAREFGVNLQIPHSYEDEDYGMLNVTALQVDTSDDGTVHYIEASNIHSDFAFGGNDPDDRYSGNIYIHPDSYDIFKPQVGDWVKVDGYMLYVKACESVTKCSYVNLSRSFRGKESAYNTHAIDRIVERNGEAFFMPMEEK